MLNLSKPRSKPRAGGWSIMRTLQWNSFAIEEYGLVDTKVVGSCQCGNGRQSHLDIT